MRVFKGVPLALLLCVVVVLINACSGSSAVQKKPRPHLRPHLGEITLSKDVKTESSLGVAVDPTRTFSTVDKQVVALVQLENLTGTHRFRWEWFDPQGNLYDSSGNFPIRVAQGKIRRRVTTWHPLSIKGDKAAGLPGEWMVKIFIDDDLIDSRTFQLTGRKDPVALPENMESRPQPVNWGLVIGIEDYAQLPHVQYARKDALVVKDYFVKVLGVPEENIITLIDSDATKARLEGYLKKYIPANVDANTTLYVYFAGHGAPDMQAGYPYLVPFDGDTRFLEQTGYRLGQFYHDLDQLKVQRTYVFLDACFSGVAARAAEALVKGARPALMHVQSLKTETQRVVAMSAAAESQTSHSDPESEHGLFTYYLLRALGGEADTDDNHLLSVKELFDYVSSNVIRKARRLGTEQTPMIFPDLNLLQGEAIGRVPN